MVKQTRGPNSERNGAEQEQSSMVKMPHRLYAIRVVRMLAETSAVGAKMSVGWGGHAPAFGSPGGLDEATLAHFMECGQCQDDLEKLLDEPPVCGVASAFMDAYLSGEIHQPALVASLLNHYESCEMCSVDFLYKRQLIELEKLRALSPRDAAVTNLALVLLDAGLLDESFEARSLARQMLRLWLVDGTLTALEVAAASVSSDYARLARSAQEARDYGQGASSGQDASKERDITLSFLVPRMQALIEPSISSDDSWLVEIVHDTANLKDATMPQDRPQRNRPDTVGPEYSARQTLPLNLDWRTVDWKQVAGRTGSAEPDLYMEGFLGGPYGLGVLLEWVELEGLEYMLLRVWTVGRERTISPSVIKMRLTLTSNKDAPSGIEWSEWVQNSGSYECSYNPANPAGGEYWLRLSEAKETPPKTAQTIVQAALQWVRDSLRLQVEISDKPESA